MSRGANADVGERRRSQNGYWYIKTEQGWRLQHHVVMEETLGRPLRPGERVVFVNKDREDLSSENIEIHNPKRSSIKRRKAQLLARRDEINAQLFELEKEEGYM